MHFSYASGIYILRSEQIINAPIEEVWDFFSSPQNLNVLTPPDLSFSITSGGDEPAYAGQLITYKVAIFPPFKSNWVTQITEVKDQNYFIDEQRFGPYRMWHHLHQFTDLGEKTLMHDVVSFKLPFGILGRMLFPILIRPKLNKIFTYREERVASWTDLTKNTKENAVA